MEFPESHACLSVCAEISPFLCTADLTRIHGWPRISTQGRSTIHDADGTMMWFCNKSYLNLGNSFKILDMLITVRKRCAGRETRPLRLQALAPAQEDPAHWVGGKWAKPRGNQSPPRQWDEFMTDTGTAGGSRHDCSCSFML